MMITKWVDMGSDVEINIDANDIAEALSEAFEHVTRDNFDDQPKTQDVTRALNSIGAFINGLKDEHMTLLSGHARLTVAQFMEGAAKRLRNIGGGE